MLKDVYLCIVSKDKNTRNNMIFYQIGEWMNKLILLYYRKKYVAVNKERLAVYVHTWRNVHYLRQKRFQYHDPMAGWWEKKEKHLCLEYVCIF